MLSHKLDRCSVGIGSGVCHAVLSSQRRLVQELAGGGLKTTNFLEENEEQTSRSYRTARALLISRQFEAFNLFKNPSALRSLH